MYGLDEQFCGILSSYLRERMSCVRIDETYSETIESNVGVPQGPILVQFFFLHT